MPESDDPMVVWLYRILATLLTTGIIAGVAFGWSTAQSTSRLEEAVAELKNNVVRGNNRIESRMYRLEARFDAHIGNGRD